MIWRLIPLLLAWPVMAESVVATRMIKAKSVITKQDLATVDADIAGALSDVSAAIGREARVQIYPGRPVRPGDIAAAAVVERNQIVALAYRQNGLSILTEARALARGAPGDIIDVLNLSSRSKVAGQIGPDGTVYVGLTR